MKIEVIKPKEDKPYWEYPCKGICEVNGLIIGFTKEGTGCVLEKGQTNHKLYSFDKYWDMRTFTLIKEKGNNYDWSNPDFPILAKITDGEVLMIKGLGDIDNSVYLTAFNTQYLIIGDNQVSFESKEKRVE